MSRTLDMDGFEQKQEEKNSKTGRQRVLHNGERKVCWQQQKTEEVERCGGAQLQVSCARAKTPSLRHNNKNKKKCASRRREESDVLFLFDFGFGLVWGG